MRFQRWMRCKKVFFKFFFLRPRPRSAAGTGAGVSGSPPPSPPRHLARGDDSPLEGWGKMCLCWSCRWISDTGTPLSLTQRRVTSVLNQSKLEEVNEGWGGEVTRLDDAPKKKNHSKLIWIHSTSTSRLTDAAATRFIDFPTNLTQEQTRSGYWRQNKSSRDPDPTDVRKQPQRYPDFPPSLWGEKERKWPLINAQGLIGLCLTETCCCSGDTTPTLTDQISRGARWKLIMTLQIEWGSSISISFLSLPPFRATEVASGEQQCPHVEENTGK